MNQLTHNAVVHRRAHVLAGLEHFPFLRIGRTPLFPPLTRGDERGVRYTKSRSALAGASALALMLAFLGGPSVLRATEAELPKGEVIVDQYVDATGGKAAYAKLKNRLVKGTLEFVGMGIKGPTTSYHARPAKQYFVFEAEALGNIEAGTDGTVAWGITAMMGPEIKEDEERAALLREAAFDGTVNWRKLYKKAECVGVEAVDDKPCYKVVMTPNEGRPDTRYFDKESHLVVKTTTELKTMMGVVPIEATIGDYKQVDGILIPHKIEQVVAGMQRMLFVTESVKHNVEMPADRFKLPEQIQALVDKSKAEPPQAVEKAEKSPEKP